jgi:biotin synthase-like enzyme
MASAWLKPVRIAVPRTAAPRRRVHRAHFDPAEVQVSTLLSVKTGGCPEDCAYCPQAARYDTGVRRTS